MKKIIFSLLAICLFTVNYSQESAILKGEDAYHILNNANVIRTKSYTDVPNYIQFIEGKESNEKEIFGVLNRFSKNPLNFNLLSVEKDKLGMEHHRYQQTINGIPVDLTMLITHMKGNKVISVNGDVLSKEVNTKTPTIPFSTALYIAKGDINAEVYKWENPNEEMFIKMETNDPSATFMPQNKLVYIVKNGDFNNELRLAYKLDIYAMEPLSRDEIYIDAVNGEILFKNNLIHTADVVGSANTAYSGSRAITADSFGGSYRLRETGRGNGIETYDLNQGTSYGSAVDFTDNDNIWNNANAQLDEYAGDAHWGAEMTYDYYMQIHSRNSIDGAGFKLKSYIHYSSNYTNAFWDGSRMTYGDGGTGYTPLTSMAIAGHEITHGLISNTAGLVYSYESGALNESFADIFGVSIDFWSRPGSANWLMGDEITTGSNYFRSMSNPNAKNDPDTYLGTYWHTSSSDNGGVHTNSGVQNFWYYLMVNGGSGTNDNSDPYTVTALGQTKAEKIAFRNLTVYLTSSSQYADARFYAIQSAVDLYGPCSPEVQSTTDAWYAVGVGNAFTPGVTADFTAANTLGCAAPFNVAFTNLSNNSTTYNWDFGDGGTSTAANPTHTYTANGTYTVTLIADGGACGRDTIVKTAYINISPSNPCPITLPPGGTAPTQTACTGIMYDNGGAAGNYSPNQDTYVTIAPTGASQVTLNFNQFDVEAYTGCGYDYLEIFDGPTTSSPQIGKYCNTNNPPPTAISSTGGSITLHFHSDPGLELAGFAIQWSCVTSGNPLPTAQFTGSPTTVCVGNSVTFSNNSVNATSYQWNFPGGTPSTSTATNPTVVYNTAGTYSVELIAMNGAGNDTLLRTNYIVVDTACPIILPPNGTYPTQTACTGTVYDDGGPTGNYTPNQDSYITIAPTGATSVTLHMSFFDVEPGSGSGPVPCDYDYVEVYDGASTGASLIGRYCNSSLPPASITSTGGAITIYFHTDPGLHLQGFKIDWQCSTSSPGPIANFSSNTTLVCAGDVVQFYDQSTGSPTSWNWTFQSGAPGSSTMQNPTVTYSSPGTFDVTLQVSNGAGSNTKTKIGHITVFDVLSPNFSSSVSGPTANFTDLSTGATQWSWDFGDGGTSNSQNTSHTYASTGTYTVCLLIDNPACDTVSTCQTVTITSTAGIEEAELIDLVKIFPNPSNGLVNVHVNFTKNSSLDLKVIDVLGKVHYQSTSSNEDREFKKIIDISELSRGTYVLYINNVPYKITRE